MKRTLSLLCAVVTLMTGCTHSTQDPNLTLWYQTPATRWTEALPLGNGRIGAMVFGGIQQERIQFNEETLWTGEPRCYDHPGAADYLSQIRQLLFEGKQDQAEQLAGEHFMSIPLRQENYQPFGEVVFSFDYGKQEVEAEAEVEVEAYRRYLDLANALSGVTYEVDGVTYRRESFISQPHQVLVQRLEASRKNALQFSVTFDAPHLQKTVRQDADGLWLEVAVADSPMRGQALLNVETDGQVTAEAGTLTITQATHATVLLSAATNFTSYKELSNDPKAQNLKAIAAAENVSYQGLKKAHLQEYHALFSGFSITLGPDNRSDLPTDRRIVAFSQEAQDAALPALYVQYGRYLLIASSRPGTFPANLQGIWNQDMKPSWGSKYTANINLEMNYWLANISRLAACNQPLFSLIEDVSQTGRATARTHYNARGWVIHHNTDQWRGTAPINASDHGIYAGTAGWLCTHLWEHFLYTQDTLFLRDRAWPIMKEASRFYADFLTPDLQTGWLISTPSNSPENGGLVAGPTMDHQIIRQLFQESVACAKILGVDSLWADTLQTLIPCIAPNQIGRYGQLQEWLQDVDDPNNHHRHVSHLWGVYPGTDINWDQTPELMWAAHRSLELRGDEGTGWSLAWKINLQARFLEAAHAYNMVRMIFRPVEFEGVAYDGGGGSYPNLFDAHPPFQIDGNFGAAAGILEMLLQSHRQRIDLLPALPQEWPDGHIEGICARGGFTLSFAWKDGALEQVTVHSTSGNPCTLVYGHLTTTFNTVAGRDYAFDSQLKPLT